jgi:hypothetical protein
MRKIARFVVALFLLAVAAQAQNYVYTFYDGLDGTGNVLATYSGPLLSSALSNTLTSGFFINTASFADPNFSPTTVMQPCLLAYSERFPGPIMSIICVNYATSLPIPPGTGLSFQISFSTALPTTPGTYNVNSFAGGSDLAGLASFRDTQSSCTGAICSVNILSFTISTVQTYSCTGFLPPFDVPLLLTKKTKRPIPTAMQLFDATNNIVTDQSIAGAAPVVNISYAAVNSTATDETWLLDATDQASIGNSFTYNPTRQAWQFNLDTKPFTALGTYTVTVNTGDTTKYAVSPTCTGTFVRQ